MCLLQIFSTSMWLIFSFSWHYLSQSKEICLFCFGLFFFFIKSYLSIISFIDFYVWYVVFKKSLLHSRSSAAAAAAAAKSLQSCSTLCDPLDGSPPGSPIPGILQARTLEWVAISFSNAWKWKVKVKSLSRVRLVATPWTAAYQAPLSMGFSRQEYWSGVLLPSPQGHLDFFLLSSRCFIVLSSSFSCRSILS